MLRILELLSRRTAHGRREENIRDVTQDQRVFLLFMDHINELFFKIYLNPTPPLLPNASWTLEQGERLLNITLNMTCATTVPWPVFLFVLNKI